MLKDKRVLLTGATGGIGRQVAFLLKAAGTEVTLTARHEEKLQSLLAELKSVPFGRGRFYAVTSDLRDLASLRNLVDRASKLLQGPINVLINNAGIAFHSPVGRIDKEELLEVFHVNALAPILLASKVFELMRENGGGQIINVTSVLGERAMSDTGSYTASKHALSGFSKVLRREGASVGISVVQIQFGAVETDFLKNTHDMATATRFRQRNLRRIDPKVAAEWILTAMNTDPSVCPEVITVVPTEQLV